jgi:hypothetical protein
MIATHVRNGAGLADLCAETIPLWVIITPRPALATVNSATLFYGKRLWRARAVMGGASCGVCGLLLDIASAPGAALRIDEHSRVEHALWIKFSLCCLKRGREKTRALAIVPRPMIAANSVMMCDRTPRLD